MVDVARFESFIEPQALARIYAAMLEASGGAANVYGHQDVGRINPLVRRTTQLTVPDEIVQFVAHQDGNTPLIRDKARFRRVSIVIYVNADYSGGSLLLRTVSEFRRAHAH
jgi:predicted 2-oxoglutarate/Fe(II)-dependent dioxygenase YbiX